MKKNKALLLAAVVSMMGLSAVKVAAEDQTDQTKDWNVTYSGGKTLEADWDTGTEIQDTINNMQPGDKVTFNITLHNTSSKKTDFYMFNEVLQTFAEGSEKGGAYTYKLTYDTSGGKTVTIYSSDTVGGDDTSNGEGLHDATNGLKPEDGEYFFLETLSKGKSGVVKLTVAMEGETHINDYQKSQAKIAMKFAAELPPEPSKSPRTEVIKREEKRYIYLPNTGDSSHLTLYAFVFGVSLALLLYAAYRLIKGSKEGQAQ